MPTEIKNAQISFVSLVDKAANKKKFAIIKAEVTPTFERTIPIIKVDEEKRLVTGIVYEPDVLDAHGEFMTAEEIEKSAHQFLKDYRNIDKQHDFVAGQADVVESWIAKEDGKLGNQDIKKGTWSMTVHVSDDDTWGEIRKGELTGFSMGGVGERMEHIEKSEAEQATGLLRLLKNFFGVGGNSPVQKGMMADAYNAKTKQTNFWNAFSTLENVLYRCCDGQCSTCMTRCTCNMETDPAKIQEALAEFSNIITEILSSGDVMKSIGRMPEAIAKAGKKISGANMAEIKSAHEALSKLIEQNADEESEEVKKEEVEKMLTESISKALGPISSKIDAIEKNANTAPASAEPAQELADVTPDSVAKMVTEAVNKAVEPLAQRIEKVETARGVVKQVEPNEPQSTTPVRKGYMDFFK